jgi:hypothetical protein
MILSQIHMLNHIASNGRMTVDNEVERKWKVAVVGYFMVNSRFCLKTERKPSVRVARIQVETATYECHVRLEPVSCPTNMKWEVTEWGRGHRCQNTADYQELATLARKRKTDWLAGWTSSSNCPSLLSLSFLYDFPSLSHVLPTPFYALCSS